MYLIGISEVRKVAIMVYKIAKCGEIIGKVINQKKSQDDTPSISAASVRMAIRFATG